MLAALAASTERIRLGTMVSPVTFRPASVLAKNVVTVDHVSNGRVELGIGAGWYEAEHETYGFPFGTTRERLDELDRQLAEITRQFDEADDIRPQPVQRPRPPIIVGGRAKPRTVQAAIGFADEYNTVFPTVDEARERRRILDDAARAGRPRAASLLDDDRLRRRTRPIGCERAHRGVARTDRPGRLTGDRRHDRRGRREAARSTRQVGVERAMLQHLVHEDVEMVAVLGELAARLG